MLGEPQGAMSSIVPNIRDTSVISIPGSADVSSAAQIPLTIPFCEDPRAMHKKRLIRELINRGVCAEGSKDLLAARLLKILCVDEPLKVDCRNMDDLQPEKWWYFCEVAEWKLHEMESRKDVLMRLETEIDTVLNQLKTDKDAMIAIALGDRRFENESELYNVGMQFKSAFSLAMAVELFQCEQHKKMEAVNRSRCVFLWRYDLAVVPEHLTEIGVLQRERKLGTITKCTLPVDGGVTIELGQVINIKRDSESVACMVVRWEVDTPSNADGSSRDSSERAKKRPRLDSACSPKVKVVAMPISTKDDAFEFKLTIQEYLHAFDG